MVNLHNVFEHAIEAVERFGWTQGRLIREDGSCCALGAVLLGTETEMGVSVWRADGDKLNELQMARQQAHTVLGQLLHYREADPYGAVADWNDKKGRTQDEVVDLLRRAAEKVKDV